LKEIADQLATDESAVSALTTVVSGKAAKATTLAGYGITDGITAATAASTYAAKATTLSGYGITDAYTKTAVDTALSGKADKATTLAGYGITDGITAATAASTYAAKSTTLAGYGIVLTSANVATALGFTPVNPTNTLSGGSF
jgi:hypothetical protein